MIAISLHASFRRSLAVPPLRFARAMTQPSFGAWRKRPGTRVKVGGCWVVRFNARGLEGLIDGKAPGTTCKLNDSQRQAVTEMVENGPTPAIHGVVRGRLKDLTLWIWEEFRISISETTLSRELRSLGYRKLSARPRHSAQNPQALASFTTVSP